MGGGASGKAKGAQQDGLLVNVVVTFTYSSQCSFSGDLTFIGQLKRNFQNSSFLLYRALQQRQENGGFYNF